MRALKRRLNHKNPNVQLLSLGVGPSRQFERDSYSPILINSSQIHALRMVEIHFCLRSHQESLWITLSPS